MDKVTIRFLEYLQRIIVQTSTFVFETGERAEVSSRLLVSATGQFTHIEHQDTSHRRNPPSSGGHTCSSQYP